MTEKDKIVGRIREALKAKAPVPGRHGVAVPHACDAEQKRPRDWLPPVGPSPAEWLAQFQTIAEDLKAAVKLVRDRAELASSLRQLRDVEGWKKVGVHSGRLTDLAADALGLPHCRTDKTYDVHDLESCDAGITECDALIAQTGSVLVTNRSAGGRALSVLPPHHVVLATKEQLAPDVLEAFALVKKKYAANYPSFLSLITGPSRTGDIERILVLGAHGPKKLTIFIVEGGA